MNDHYTLCLLCTQGIQAGSRRFDAIKCLRTRVHVPSTPCSPYMFVAQVQFRRTTQNSCELPLHTVFAPHSRCSGRCEEVRCSRTTPHWSTLEYTYPTHLVLSAHRFVEKVQYSHTGSCVWETRLLRCIVLACSVHNSCCLYI